MAGHVTSPRASLIVFVVLMVLLVVTVLAAQIEHPVLGIVIALTIATVKALLIMVYFMNLRFADNVTRMAAGAGFAGLLLLLAFALADYLTRDRPRGQGQAPVAKAKLLDIGGVKVSDAG